MYTGRSVRITVLFDVTHVRSVKLVHPKRIRVIVIRSHKSFEREKNVQNTADLPQRVCADCGEHEAWHALITLYFRLYFQGFKVQDCLNESHETNTTSRAL